MKTIQLRFPVTRRVDTLLSPVIGAPKSWKRHAYEALLAFNDALTCLAQGNAPYIYWPIHLARGTRPLIPELFRARDAYPLFHIQLQLDEEVWRDRLDTRIRQAGLTCRRDLAFSAIVYYAEIQRLKAREGCDICFPRIHPSLPLALLESYSK